MIVVDVGPEVLRFASFRDWLDHAKERFADAREARGGYLDYVCIDASGRICTSGKQFMRARDDGSYPVIVYLVDPA